MPNKKPNQKLSLDDKYAPDAARAYLTGIEALVRLPILQRRRDAEAGLNTAGLRGGDEEGGEAQGGKARFLPP